MKGTEEATESEDHSMQFSVVFSSFQLIVLVQWSDKSQTM